MEHLRCVVERITYQNAENGSPVIKCMSSGSNRAVIAESRQIMEYEGTLYRPPSEANSLIIQVTVGCAHNTCTFCNMYKQKKFRIRSEEEIIADLREVADSPNREFFDRVFFADGDALCIPTEMMLRLLQIVRDWFPRVQRVTAYATAMDVIRKPDEELEQLQKAGLQMVYMGVESGDAEIRRYCGIYKKIGCR